MDFKTPPGGVFRDSLGSSYLHPRAAAMTGNDKAKDGNRLRIVATSCWKIFENCSRISDTTLSSQDADLRTSLVDQEYDRFKVWCGSLGVRQSGHASLDWRLKDAEMVENETCIMLKDLEDDLGQCHKVLTGDRPPYERDDTSIDDTSSDASSTSDSSSPGELQVRLDTIQSTIGTLYRMSHLIRNQRTRRLALHKAQNYQPRDKFEAAILEAYITSDRSRVHELFQQLRRNPNRTEDEPELRTTSLRDGDKQSRVLKARLVETTIARRRQLTYFKMHSEKLKAVVNDTEDTDDPEEPRAAPSATEVSGLIDDTKFESTPLDSQSLTSFASSVRDDDGNETRFPGPPERKCDDEWFECPFCFVLCQPKEAGSRRWRKHILEDLRPYVCTYMECQEPLQLFATTREWIAHETLHSSQPTDIKKLSEFSASSTTATGARSAKHNRAYCPICLVSTTTIPKHFALAKHIASHLEHFALICVPPGAWNEDYTPEDDSDSSDLDHDELVERNEQSIHDAGTGSTGHSTAPGVDVSNDHSQDANLRADPHSPPPMSPYLPQPYPAETPVASSAAELAAYPAQVPPAAKFRGRTNGLESALAEELEERRLERRMRSLSRSRSDEHEISDLEGEARKAELRLERERRHAKQREDWERWGARITADLEIKRLKDEAKRAADDEKLDLERKRVIEEYELKRREAKEVAKMKEIRMIERMEREKRDAREEELQQRHQQQAELDRAGREHLERQFYEEQENGNRGRRGRSTVNDPPPGAIPIPPHLQHPNVPPEVPMAPPPQHSTQGHSFQPRQDVLPQPDAHAFDQFDERRPRSRRRDSVDSEARRAIEEQRLAAVVRDEVRSALRDATAEDFGPPSLADQPQWLGRH